MANNRHDLHLFINFILRHSCAKTLARKLNLGSRGKVFAKFGQNLATKEKPVMRFFTEENYRWDPFKVMPEQIVSPFGVLN